MATKKSFVALLTLMSVFLMVSCAETTATTNTTTCDTFGCSQEFSETMYETIPIQSLTSPTSLIQGNVQRFICTTESANAITFSDSTIKLHKIIFELDASYPIYQIVIDNTPTDNATPLTTIHVDISLNGSNYTRILTDYPLTQGINTIEFNSQNARYIRISFPAEQDVTYSLSKVSFILGSGYIVREDPDWAEAFKRTEYWTGGDGIFSFALDGENEWKSSDSNVAFVFGDTFTASVNPATGYRYSTSFINNSVGYYDGNENPYDGLSFDYRTNDLGKPESAFLPDYYIGYTEHNLLVRDGLSIYPSKDGLLTNEANGYGWRSEMVSGNYLTIDFEDSVAVKELYLWNENENPQYGVKNIRIDTSVDGVNYVNGQIITVPQAGGSAEEPYTLKIELNNIVCRYVRITILSGYSEEMVGIGKLLFLNSDGDNLFGQISANDTLATIEGNETTSRLWSQDGIVLDGSLYLFPLLIKNDASAFKVTTVGLIKTPIVNGTLDLENAEYISSPLYAATPEGGVIYFGAGILDNRDVDGYIYIYGYKDYDGRNLVVARTTAEHFTDFNYWEYFDGTGYSKDILDVAPLKSSVSPELSVTYMTEGIYQGKYMLVVMEGTTSGRVSYAISDTPTGEFSEYNLLYETSESLIYTKAFTYNAKMHPALSTPTAFRISYNVNTSSISELGNVEVYYPRFILVTEVNMPQGDD